MAGWLPNLRIHTYYLPSYLYADGEKPEDPYDDICFGPVDMQDPSGMIFEIQRGGKHMVDDRKVAIFQLLFQKGNYIFYKHGNQKFRDTILPFKISLLDIEDHPVGEPCMKDVQVLDGRGILPDEQEGGGGWEHPYNEDDEITGVKAFCISIDILRNPNNHSAWAVQKARKSLRIESKTAFDISHFERQKEQSLISEAITKFLFKRGSAGNPLETLPFMFMFGGPTNGMMGGKQKCMYCEKEERNLDPGKKLLRCSRCGNAVYCGEKCQREDWKVHRNVCVRADLSKKKGPLRTGHQKKKGK